MPTRHADESVIVIDIGGGNRTSNTNLATDASNKRELCDCVTSTQL